MQLTKLMVISGETSHIAQTLLLLGLIIPGGLLFV